MTWRRSSNGFKSEVHTCSPATKCLPWRHPQAATPSTARRSPNVTTEKVQLKFIDVFCGSGSFLKKINEFPY